MIKVSATRISSFLRCKQKYYFQYVNRLPKLSNASFKLGIACHESLEAAGRIWMEKESFTKQDYKDILALYNKISVREGIEDQEVNILGKSLVKARMDNFLPRGKILTLEEKFGFEGSQNQDLITPSGVPVMGAMDVVVEVDEDTLMIIDYKTSRTAQTPDQLKVDLQLSLYDLVASILYPQYKRVILCLDMLKMEPVYTYRTPGEREEFDQYLATVYQAMCEFEEKDAKPSLNIFCSWCDAREFCKDYVEAYKRTDYNFLTAVQMSDADIVAEWEQVRNTVKILENRKRDLDMILMEKIKSEGEDVKGDTKQVYIRQSSRTTYDTKTVCQLVPPEDLLGLVSLNKKAVDDYCESHPKIKKEIMAGAIVNFTSPFLASKNVKVKKVEAAVLDESSDAIEDSGE